MLSLPLPRYNTESPQQHVYDDSFDEDDDEYQSRLKTFYPRPYFNLPVPLDLLNLKIQIAWDKKRTLEGWVDKDEEYLASNTYGMPFQPSAAGDTGLAYYDPSLDAPGVDDVSWRPIHQLQAWEFIRLFYHDKIAFHQSFVCVRQYRVIRPCIPSLTANMVDVDINHLWDGQHRVRNQPFKRVHHFSWVIARYFATFGVPGTTEVCTVKLRFVEYPCPYWLAGRTTTGAAVLFCNHPENAGGMQLFFEAGTNCEHNESKMAV